MTDQDLKLIENFITKEEPRKEFNEMQALVKMIYDTYDSNKDMDDLRKSMSKVLEIDYQLQHRKVGNRYSSDKFLCE